MGTVGFLGLNRLVLNHVFPTKKLCNIGYFFQHRCGLLAYSVCILAHRPFTSLLTYNVTYEAQRGKPSCSGSHRQPGSRAYVSNSVKVHRTHSEILWKWKPFQRTWSEACVTAFLTRSQGKVMLLLWGARLAQHLPNLARIRGTQRAVQTQMGPLHPHPKSDWTCGWVLRICTSDKLTQSRVRGVLIWAFCSKPRYCLSHIVLSKNKKNVLTARMIVLDQQECCLDVVNVL